MNTNPLVNEIAAILNDFDMERISEKQRDEAIEAIAARGRQRNLSRITEIAVTAVDQDAA
jgi:hypothetical protein